MTKMQKTFQMSQTERVHQHHEPQQDVLFEQNQQYRIGAYVLLAALLRDIPDQSVLEHTKGLAGTQADLNDAERGDDTGDELSVAMSMLGLAAQHSDSMSVDDEFHNLFIGLGRGEVLPYGSWYMTGFLMEKPLGQLRHDLNLLGYERVQQSKEPEDHIAALCEVMAMLVQEQHSITAQSTFFNQHLAPWSASFFSDLSTAPSASFYQAVARFGSAFMQFETQYFGIEV